MPIKIGLKEKQKIRLEHELEGVVPILIEMEEIAFFGSLAKGNVNKASDLDIFVVMETEKPFLEKVEDVYTKFGPVNDEYFKNPPVSPFFKGGFGRFCMESGRQ